LLKNDTLEPANYLRAAQAYMLISMPTGTSTIFGAFQAIVALPANADAFRPYPLNYLATKTSPVNSCRAWLISGLAAVQKKGRPVLM
jgi:hypothetical protein